MSAPSASSSERRAILARLSLCSFAAVLSLALVAPAACVAGDLAPPFLDETNPASPGASLTPKIHGGEEEVQTKVAIPQGGWLTRGAISHGLEPSNTVRIYAQEECAGLVVAEGPMAQLEGEGIPVTVSPESTTNFSATQSNASETSSCSQSLAYRQVSSAPDAPTFTSSNPPSPANYNFPRLIGDGDPDATISIYTDDACSGAPAGTGSGDEFESSGIEVTVGDNSETSFYAKAGMAGFSSACSADSMTYREVTPPLAQEGGGGTGGSGGTGGGSGGSGGGGASVGGGSTGSGNAVAPASPVTRPSPPPAPQLRTVPGRIGNDTTPMLTGSAPGASTVFVYASSDCTGQPVAKGSADQFASTGFEVQVVPNETATFSASSGVAGAQSGCSAPASYVEDSLAPRTRITMGPASKTAKRKAVFRFTDVTGNPPGTTFLCKLGKAKWKPCSSPFNVRRLKARSYLVRVRAIDEAGNAEAKGATRRFRVIGSR
jgi:uncharacterized membrane protein YgcG